MIIFLQDTNRFERLEQLWREWLSVGFQPYNINNNNKVPLFHVLIILNYSVCVLCSIQKVVLVV